MGFIDLHSHIVAGIDDGAGTDADTAGILKGLVALGYETVCATPHQKSGQFLPSLEAIAAGHRRVLEIVEELGLAVTVPLAAENMWDEVFYQRMEADEIPSYAAGPAFLIEFRTSELPLGIDQQLFRLRTKGRLPVIAHPERYSPLWRDDGLVDELGQSSALVVDLGAVGGYHGRKAAKTARRWLQQGRVHAAASDCHSVADLRSVAEGMAWIRKKLGDDALSRLCEEAPRAILAGHHPADL